MPNFLPNSSSFNNSLIFLFIINKDNDSFSDILDKDNNANEYSDGYNDGDGDNDNQNDFNDNDFNDNEEQNESGNEDEIIPDFG